MSQQQYVEDQPDIVIEARHITMAFPGTLALDDVSYRVYRGRVNVIIGENGAGKSTLMKILAGVQQPTSGTLKLNGREISLKDTRDASAHGIGMVHQELNLFENLTVTENIFLGREIHKPLRPIDSNSQKEKADALLKQLNQNFSADEKVGNLKVGQQQLVEIARALSEKADILILDEPTSALSKTEVEILFRVIRELTSKGVTIIYISHRLEELMEIGDHITILRDGHFQTEARVDDITVNWIVREMLGDDPVSSFLGPDRQFGDTVLSVENVSMADDSGGLALDDVSLNLKEGEIVGIYGLMGAGRTELFECLLGTSEYSGRISVYGEEIKPSTPTSHRIRKGISLVPEDRKRSGIFPVTSVARNMTMSNLWRWATGYRPIDAEKELAAVGQTVSDLSIKISGPEVEIQALSGGNQQKVVIGRSLMTHPKILLLDEPTRGIDVGAKVDVFEMMARLSGQGIGILFSTSDLKEIMAVSDRILVMANGRVTANIPRSQATESQLVHASTPR